MALILTTPDEGEPTCPVCGSDDLGVFTSDADTREDEADLWECESCKAHGMTAEFAAQVN